MTRCSEPRTVHKQRNIRITLYAHKRVDRLAHICKPFLYVQIDRSFHENARKIGDSACGCQSMRFERYLDFPTLQYLTAEPSRTRVGTCSFPARIQVFLS
jgi:hypothetical protein